MLKKIFDGQSADGDSLDVAHAGGQVEVIVGDGPDGAHADFGGGTVTLMATYADVGFPVPVDGGEWTESLVKVLSVPRKCTLTLRLSGAAAPDLDAWI